MNIQEERIANVLVTKYLGIQVDRNLNWKGHITAIGFIKHAKSILPQNTVNWYFCSVWGNCGEIEKSHLQKLQNRAARILTNSCHDAHARSLPNTLGLK